jgi:hypothetical protein
MWAMLLVAAASSASGDWAVCVFRTATELAESTATASEIADAAMANCRSHQFKARQAWIDEALADGKNGERAAAFWDANVATMKEDRRQDAIAAVLKVRISKK